ncbi:hypothetical protein [Streptomyces sp. BE133]|uniref:hypothetical protein n=1 Tax=Streptomyces sp. BE133 TaxID=3002523 RepID=UPI002E77D9E1|nr:hypothetical protein [Streptomyces sp. BE133]MEE1812677.1 hypothetical protein [Streptomyces sp. BE133]
MTTHHTPAPTAPVTDLTARYARLADQALADRCQSSGDYLAGLLAKGMLDAAGTPKKLPELLFPDYDPEIVRAVWETALPVGFRAGKLAGQPRWTPDALTRLRAILTDAGYEAMGALAARSASVHPPRHPADDEPLDTTVGNVRDGGHP